MSFPPVVPVDGEPVDCNDAGEFAAHTKVCLEEAIVHSRATDLAQSSGVGPKGASTGTVSGGQPAGHDHRPAESERNQWAYYWPEQGKAACGDYYGSETPWHVSYGYCEGNFTSQPIEPERLLPYDCEQGDDDGDTCNDDHRTNGQVGAGIRAPPEYDSSEDPELKNKCVVFHRDGEQCHSKERGEFQGEVPGWWARIHHAHNGFCDHAEEEAYWGGEMSWDPGKYDPQCTEVFFKDTALEDEKGESIQCQF